jgi:short-subunit dehydrogenase
MTRSSDFEQRYGPWAIVTGASSGIGEHFARQLARRGFNLMLVARRRDRLDALAQDLGRKRGAVVETLALDLGEPAAVDRLVAALGERDVGLVVSNAGFGLKGPFLEATRAQLEAMFNVNARTPLFLLHAVLPRLLARKRGGVILTGSQEGEAPFPWSSAYAATKAFVHSLGLGLYGELAGTGIDLLVLAPGATDTEALVLQGFKREALPPLMPPEQVAREALSRLGRAAFHVPGKDNRKFVALLKRMPRDKVVAFNAQNMAAALAASGHAVPQPPAPGDDHG